MIVQCRRRRSAARARASAPSVSAANFPICCRWPGTSLRSPAGAASSTAPDRPSSIVAPEPESANNNPLKRNGDASSRSAAQPAGADRSESELAGIGACLARAALYAHGERCQIPMIVWVAAEMRTGGAYAHATLMITTATEIAERAMGRSTD